MKKNESKTYGYIRVSAKDQSIARQLDAMKSLCLPKSCLFIDKESGKDFERPAYRRLVKKIKPGDLIVVKSIDRLGRNYAEILEQWRVITKEKKVDVRVLDMPLLDTSHNRDLTGTLIADIVLQLLSYVAQSEREAIRQRQAEGIAAAKLRGIKFGRPILVPPDNFLEVYTQWKNKEFNSRKAAAFLKVSQPTFLKWVKSFEKKGRLFFPT